MARDTLANHHEAATRDHLHLMTSAVYQLFTTSDTVPDLPHIPTWPHELPANLWERVGDGGESSRGTNIPWTELPGCEVQAERYSAASLGKKVIQLEEWKVNAQMRMTQADAKINTLRAEVVTSKETITTLNGEMVNAKEKIETLTVEKVKAFGDIKILGEQNKRLSDTTEVLMEDIKGMKVNEENMKTNMDDMARNFNGKMKKLEENMNRNITKRISVVETLTDDKIAQVNQVVKDANSQIEKSTNDISFMKSLVDYGEVKDLVEGVHTVCPCSWRVKLVTNTERITSPAFYTSDGYLMMFRVKWIKNQFTVGALLRKGQNDDNLEWPWNGREIVTVTNTATGHVLGVCPNFSLEHAGRTRLYDAARGNFSFFTYTTFKADMENTVLTMTIKKPL